LEFQQSPHVWFTENSQRSGDEPSGSIKKAGYFLVVTKISSNNILRHGVSE
jgi:hypothetical protein